jgi:DNA (cytosine-5)-methyltransferase 1
VKSIINMADLFCGAGGTSAGAEEAIEALGYRCSLTAINHWPVAVATHGLNHPGARHLCASLDSLNPRDLFGDGELDLLWASPECTHHSIARGGKPINDQSRATAWCVVRWAEALRPSVILIENVPEFRTWGPIGSDGRPLKSRKGEIFQSWISALEAIGYKVDHRILVAADYGDPTTRRRLFIQAVRGRRQICWPEPTHSRDGRPGTLPWVPARDIIDWGLASESIFTRARPLKPKTISRIMAGLNKFGLAPFLARYQGDHVGRDESARCAQDLDKPLPTVTTENRFGVVQPFLITTTHGNSGKKNAANWNAHSVDAPVGSVTSAVEKGLVEPFLIAMENKGSLRSLSDPLNTVTTARCGATALVEPFLIQTAHAGDDRVAPVTEPLRTVAGNRGSEALVEPFIVQMRGTNADQIAGSARSLSDPLGTITGSGSHHGIVEAGLLPQQSDGALRPVSAPAPTVATAGAIALVQAFLVKYYGAADGAQSIGEPLDTVTARERHALVQPEIVVDGQRYRLDIRFRMLQPHELAAAQGFRTDYRFTGNKTETVRQIGNAVPRRLARAIVAASLGQQANIHQLLSGFAA